MPDAPDALLLLPNAVVVVLMAALGVVVLRASPRATTNRLFAAYALLVAGNYALAGLAAAGGSGPGWPTSAKVGAFVLQLLDPLAFVWFAGLYPRPNWLGRPAARAAAAVAAGLLAIFFAADPQGFARPGNIWFEAYVTVAYVVVIVNALRLEWGRPAGAAPAFPPGFLLGVAVVVFYRIGPALNLSGEAPGGSSASWAAGWAVRIAIDSALGWSLLAALLLGAALLAPPTRRPEVTRLLRGSAIAWAVLTGVLLVPLGIIAIVWTSPGPILNGLAHLATVSRYAIRWVFFAVTVGPALLRNQVFRIETHLRRALVTSIVAGVLVATFVAAALLIEGSLQVRGSLPVKAIVILALLVLVGSQSVALGRRVGRRFFPPEREQDAAYRRMRRFEVYRDAARAVADGRAPPEDLERLRATLGLSPEEARLAASIARHPAPAQPIRPGARLGSRYTVERQLGRGGHGRVFLARDERENALVAVKEVPSADESAARRIEGEVGAAARLRHTNLLPPSHFFVDGGTAYVVSPYMPGGSLADRLGAGPLPTASAARVMADVLAGLEHAHAHGVVHRDVKPANILFDADGSARLADFGVALVQDAEQTVTSIAGFGTTGTPGFLPPEAAESARASPAWDVFAAGRTLRLALGGDAGSALDRVAAKASAARPEDRYATAAAMRAAILDAG